MDPVGHHVMMVTSGDSDDDSTNNMVRLSTSVHHLKIQRKDQEELSSSDQSICIGNPLQNPVVMSTVSKYLPPADLVRLRSTCKAWNAALIPELRRRGPIILLSSGGSSGNYFSPYGPAAYGLPSEPGANLSPPPKVSDFSSTMSTSALFPFGRIKIELNSPYRDSRIHAFLASYGQFITYLELVFQHHPINLHIFRAMLFKQLLALQELVLQQSSSRICSPNEFFWRQDRLWGGTAPALTKLTLSINLDGDVALGFLTDLLNAAINLESLEIADRWTDSKSNIPTIFNALKGKSSNLDKLKTLSLDENFNEADVQILIELNAREVNGLQLKQLKLHHKGIHWTGDVGAAQFVGIMKQLQIFLFYQAQSLELFEFTTFHGKPFQLELPSCPKLKSLKLLLVNDGSMRFNNTIKLQSSFAINFPALETFDYKDCGDEKSQKLTFAEQQETCTSLQKLKIEPIYSVPEVQQLTALFPNIIKLIIHIRYLSFDILTNVWRHWSNLQVLDIVKRGHLDGAPIDEVLTGIPSRHHDAIQ